MWCIEKLHMKKAFELTETRCSDRILFKTTFNRETNVRSRTSRKSTVRCIFVVSCEYEKKLYVRCGSFKRLVTSNVSLTTVVAIIISYLIACNYLPVLIRTCIICIKCHGYKNYELSVLNYRSSVAQRTIHRDLDSSRYY